MQGVSGATRILVPFEPSGRFERLRVWAPHPDGAIECSEQNHDHISIRDAYALNEVIVSSAQGLAERDHVSCVACHSQFEWFVSHLSGIRTDHGIS
jgi:hypothetical protein